MSRAMRAAFGVVVLLGAFFLGSLSCGRRCDASSCQGCCDANGECQQIGPAACATPGNVCRACSAGLACVAGACVLPGTGGSAGAGGTAGSGGGGSAGTGGSAGVGGTAGAGGTAGSGGVGGDGCSDAAKLVYLVDKNNAFLSFNPGLFGQAAALTTVGTLSCPAQAGGRPYSMAVDRSAIAWVNYDSAQLFAVNITGGLSCNATAFSVQRNIGLFGMGFVSNAAGSTQETLFLAGHPASGTGSMAQLATMTLPAATIAAPLATLNGAPELTGTGNAELWAFFPDAQMPRIAKLDKATGAATTTYPLASLAGTPGAWAFAFWGGDFWVFLRKSNETSSTIYRVSGANGSVLGQYTVTGRSIVGAGVSTCAPVVIQ